MEPGRCFSGGGVMDFVDYIIAHWRGDHSLAWSFWVTFLVGGFAFLAASMPLIWLATRNIKAPAPQIIYPLLALLIVAMTALTVWQCVGLWQSAARVDGWLPWGAQVAVVLTVLSLPVGYRAYWDQLKWFTRDLEAGPRALVEKLNAAFETGSIEGVLALHGLRGIGPASDALDPYFRLEPNDQLLHQLGTQDIDDIKIDDPDDLMTPKGQVSFEVLDVAVTGCRAELKLARRINMSEPKVLETAARLTIDNWVFQGHGHLDDPPAEFLIDDDDDDDLDSDLNEWPTR